MRALAMATLMVATLGVAEADKFSHTANVRPNVELTDRSKPPPKRDVAPARPIDADVALDLEILVGDIRVQQEKILRQLIETTPDSDPQKPEYYYLLAEIYAKQQRAHRLLSVKAELEHRDKDAERARKLAHAALVDAVGVYKAMTDNEAFRNFSKMDTALFYYGYTLKSGKYLPEARAVYDRLLKDYPASKHVPEAHLVFADHYFEANQLADAEDRYKKVLKFPRSPAYWFAMYRLGWVHLNRKDPQAALETFYQVIRGVTDPKHDVMRRAATKDFVRAYAEVGKADKALVAFARVDKKRAHDMLATLAELYIDQGKAERAIYVLRELIKEQPRHAHVCTWQHDIARQMMTAGDRTAQVHEIEQLVKLWVVLRDRKALPAGEANDCRDAAAEMSGQLARAYHQEAVKTHQDELFTHADRLYRAYLAAFATAPDAGESQYYRAELLWARAALGSKNVRIHAQQWQDTAEAFTAVLDGGKLATPLIKVAADAGMQAWMRTLAINPHKREAADTEAAYAKVATPRPIPAAEQKLLAAYDLYLKHVTDPKDDQLVDVKFLKASLYRRFDHLVEAIAGFEDILKRHRDHDAAETAAQLALDSYNRLHRHTDMLALAERLAADTKFLANKDHLRTTIGALRRVHKRKLAEQLEAEGKRTRDHTKLVDCANAYLGIYNDDPLAEDGDQLLYNAGVCFEAGKSLSGAEAVYLQLQSLFPKSKLTARSVARLGNIYAQVAKFGEAAQKLEEYAKKYAGEKDAHDALSDAVVFRKGVGDDAQAIADTELYIRTFGKKRPAEAASAMWSLTAIYEKQGDLDKLASHLRTYLDRHGATAGADRVVMAWAKLGETLWKASCPIPTVDGSCARVTRERAAERRGSVRRAKTQTTCGDNTRLKMTIVARDATKAASALAAFDRAIAEWDKRKGNASGDERGARYYYALAKHGRIERELETYLAMPIPMNLDFDPRKPAIAKKSRERFDAWIKSKFELGGSLTAKYQAVIALGDGATAIASAARVGQLSQTFAGQLYRAEIPANLRKGPYAEEASQAYCDTLGETLDPIELSAIEAYEVCLKTSTRLGWFSEWSRLCERELGQLDPQRFPTTAELRGAPDAVARIVSIEPPARL